jgi:pimeloyl-ACP methyl ester carboxylesterase
MWYPYRTGAVQIDAPTASSGPNTSRSGPRSETPCSLSSTHPAAMDLPCDDASASFETYADVVCAALDGCNHDVVLVGHSLGGNTIPLVAARRPVSHLVYLCAVIPAIGRSVFDQIAGTDMMLPGWDAGLSEPDAQSRTTWVDPDCGRTLLFDQPAIGAQWVAGHESIHGLAQAFGGTW